MTLADVWDPALAAARAVHVAAVLSLAGALGFRALVAPFTLARVTRPALVVALLAGAVWLLLQSGAMAGVGSLAEAAAVLPTVALHSWFGHVLMARLPLLLAAGLLAGDGRTPWRLWAATACAGAAVALQAALGHAAALGDPVLLATVALHLLAAAAWLGGLLPLHLALAAAGSPTAVARRFSLVGVLAVAAILATGLEQSAVLIGSLPGLLGTAYGHTALLKIALLSALVALAGLNRFAYTPRLDAQPPTLRRLRTSIAIEVLLGLAVVAAAARLGSLPPAVHEQPDWPFAVRLSLAALADPDYAREAAIAAAVLAAGVAALVLAAVLRRWRPIAAAALAGAAWFALPSFEPLLVPAYPTSFATSLTDFDGFGIARGARLFAQNCVGCHGATGRGDGPLARTLDIPPADLTAPHLWEHADGDLFWFLTHGIDSPRGQAMPGFPQLGTEARWALIDFVRANNAGRSMADGGTWAAPVPAPVIDARCPDGQIVSLESLHGEAATVTVGSAGLTLAAASTPPGCIADAPELRQAYAIVAGVPANDLPGSRFLVDPDGWLRHLLRPNDPQDAAPLLRDVALHPLVAPPALGHKH